MSLINTLSKHVLLSISDFITGQSIYKCLLFLEKSQYWTRAQMDAYQNKKLSELILHSYNNVPFYRDLMKKRGLTPYDFKSKDDLSKLPIITKDDLRQAKTKHLATNLKVSSYLLHSSSGSTGEPFQYYISKNAESFNKAASIRAWYWNGYRLGDRYVKISMNARYSKIKKIQDLANRCKYLSSTQLSPANFKEMAEKILAYDPKFIRGYPVPLEFLSEVIATKLGGYKGKSLLGINSTGSTLHEDTRKKIEDTLKVKIFDSYSCEGGANFTECPQCGAYHPSEEYAISEFIEDAYTASDPDHPVRHITTDLVNYASPFIRYDSQDYVVVKDSSQCCQCSRPYIQVKKIKGRDSDILITPSGKFLIVENFVAYFEYIGEVDLIQVVQNKTDQIDINLVVNSAFNVSIHNKIREYWEHYIGNDVCLRVNVVDEIKLTPTGKRRTVIRNPDIEIHA